MDPLPVLPPPPPQDSTLWAFIQASQHKQTNPSMGKNNKPLQFFNWPLDVTSKRESFLFDPHFKMSSFIVERNVSFITAVQGVNYVLYLLCLSFIAAFVFANISSLLL